MAQAHRVAIIAGDGVGPEVVHEGLRVLRATADRFGLEIGITSLRGGATPTDELGGLVVEQLRAG